MKEILLLRTTLASMALLTALAAPAFADTINSDAPDKATGTSVVTPRTYQLEQNVQLDFAAGTPTLSFPSLHRFGLVDNLELRLETPIVGINFPFAASRQDVDLGLKYNLEKLLPSVLPPFALFGTVHLDPSNAVYPELHLLTDIDLPAGFAVNGDVGGLYNAGTTGVNYAASFGHDITSIWRAYLEYAGEWDAASGLSHSLDGGLIYTLDDDTQLMAAIDTDIAQPFGVWYITTNYSHRWGGK